MNTMSVGNYKKNNFLSRARTNYSNNYKLDSQIQEEKK